MLKILRKTAEHVKTFSGSFCFYFYFLLFIWSSLWALCTGFSHRLYIKNGYQQWSQCRPAGGNCMVVGVVLWEHPPASTWSMTSVKTLCKSWFPLKSQRSMKDHKQAGQSKDLQVTTMLERWVEVLIFHLYPTYCGGFFVVFFRLKAFTHRKPKTCPNILCVKVVFRIWLFLMEPFTPNGRTCSIYFLGPSLIFQIFRMRVNRSDQSGSCVW